MAAKITTMDLPARIYRVVLLLTGSVRRAECAVRDAVQDRDPDCESASALLWEAVAAATRRRHDEHEPVPCAVPAPLRAVTALPPKLRNCFVLRILEGLPADACAPVLQLSPREVNSAAAEAAQALAILAANAQAA